MGAHDVPTRAAAAADESRLVVGVLKVSAHNDVLDEDLLTSVFQDFVCSLVGGRELHVL
jgi:hypothetical protein